MITQFALNLLLVSTLSCSSTIDFENREIVISIGEHSYESTVHEDSARVTRCELWPEVEGVYVLELDRGVAGTRTLTRQTDLIVLKKTEEGLKELLVRAVEWKTQTSPTDYQHTRHNYELLTEDNKPVLKLTDSGEKVGLADLNSALQKPQKKD